MSSSSVTATGSRSPSPQTPATPESSDNLEMGAIRSSIDLSTWYKSLSAPTPNSGASAYWDDGAAHPVDMGKEEEGIMLSLDDLIQDYAYDDSSSSSVPPSHSLPSHTATSKMDSPVKGEGHFKPSPDQTIASPITLSPRGPISITKPIPPPASQPRKCNSSASQTVVFPPKDSCSNLPIMTPSIPEGGTKSRVETQVRVSVDLAHASSSAGESSQYDRVGSWKWLKLPKGTATKKRTRKDGKIDPLPEDTLFLSVEVTCASPPHSRVVCCSNCQIREGKRLARKLAQRVRPQRQESSAPEGGSAAVSGAADDAFNIVQFNCPEVLDFSTGSVIFPLRITCYCRHHRERVGFKVHFIMSDHNGRVVGAGMTHPIMITDDHKSTGVSASKPNSGGDFDWSQMTSQGEVIEKVSSAKRKQTHTLDPFEQSKKRPRSSKVSRKDSLGSLDSPSVFTSTLPTRTTTPSPFFSSDPPSQFSVTAPSSPRVSDNFIIQNAETFLPSPSASVSGLEPASFDTTEMVMPSQPLTHESGAPIERTVSPSTFLPTAPPSPVSIPLSQMQVLHDSVVPTLPFMFFPNPPLPTPKIHRLIPSSGPTFGGIEVTVLGANFHSSLQLNCIFGDVTASSTQRWSENTLVCILPPRVTSGVVAVWFNEVQKEEDGTPPCLFTYTDESDRALMELALQVVGLKMTGKLEDAKSVAMRIVGPSGDDSQGSSSQTGMQLAANNLTLSHDVRSMLRHVGADEGLENMVLELLSLLDVHVDSPSAVSLSIAVSHQTNSGQTLLHIAAFLKYPLLVKFLIEHGVDMDARDRNGYTALHFAGLVGAEECAAILIDAGADQEIVSAVGKTAQEVASFDFEQLQFTGGARQITLGSDVDEEESRWGDGEEESEDDSILRSHATRRPSRTTRRGIETPVSVSSEDEAITEAPHDSDKLRQEEARDIVVDEKVAATFMNAIQRTLARVQPTQGIIPNMPHLPLPHFRNLPGMPAVPWGALPQIPMVFPVDVPWPAFLGDKRGERADDLQRGQPKGTMRALLTPQEWRAFWEKWLMQGTAPATDDPPPMYTPRDEVQAQTKEPAASEASQEDESAVAGSSAFAHERLVPRRVGYDSAPVPDQEVNAYAYRPPKTQARQIQKKEDRMLLLFWIPILFVALLWALFHGIRMALHFLRTVTPLRAMTRV